jgi:hypothetical protein
MLLCGADFATRLLLRGRIMKRLPRAGYLGSRRSNLVFALDWKKTPFDPPGGNRAKIAQCAD